MIEMIGYLGSALVVASMLMSSVVKLRIINTIGSGIFAAYALMIHSYPTALMNVFLVGINVYNLVKLSQKDRSYDLVEGTWGRGSSPLPAGLLQGGHSNIFPRLHPGLRGGPGLYRLLQRKSGRRAAGNRQRSGDPAGAAGLLHPHLPRLLHRDLSVLQAALQRRPHPGFLREGVPGPRGLPDQNGLCQKGWGLCQESDRSSRHCFIVSLTHTTLFRPSFLASYSMASAIFRQES